MMLKRLLLLLLSCSLASTNPTSSQADPGKVDKSEPWTPLLERLTADGFSRDYLVSIFADERVEREESVFEANVYVAGSKRDFSHRIEPRSISLGKGFLSDNGARLNGIEKNFGVPKEVIAAILVMESNAGTTTGRHRIFNVFWSLAVGGEPDNLERISREITSNHPSLSRKVVEERTKRKAGWAYGELTFLLKIGEREKIDVLDVTGSWAGAFGIPQFLPSSYWHYAVDGNGDGKVRLSDAEDAAASVANYLSRHGWKNSLGPEGKRKVVWYYNRSQSYAETVMGLAERLRGK
jgi:membrane-bound lytic murein transglycosylase B